MQSVYEKSIAAKAKVDLYDDAVKRYKEEVDVVALEKDPGGTEGAYQEGSYRRI